MARVAELDERAAGVLLHVTSLPGPHGSGDLGPSARAFADHLAAAGITWWQTPPVVPPGYTGSPYDSPSAFAGSPWLVSLTDLAADGLLDAADATLTLRDGATFAEIQAFREPWLRKAHARSVARAAQRDTDDLEVLRATNPWLRDWALFSALKRRFPDQAWCEWDAELAARKATALERAANELADEISYHEHVQLWFRRQWRRLREHCAQRNVALLGDVPMFVAHDSADVWSHREAFFLDETGKPTVVAGVPPDPFSATGQLWGNPLYRWDYMQRRGFDWWMARLGETLERFDAVRLDHFIAFHRYWEIPSGATDARVGRFVQVPGDALFERARELFGGLPFLAEDLGIVTPEVHALRDRFRVPGMRVLQFAFGSDEPNDYRPHRFVQNTAVYTGTHDNDTTVGWYAAASDAERQRVVAYLGGVSGQIQWDLVRAALASVANLAVFPIQDVLGLGSESRMNTPGTVEGNWSFRVKPEALTPELAERLRGLCGLYERTPRWNDGDSHAFVRG
ncbi:MAG: 4-alpha-glucanotransferase [Polyangiaceae bacterium]